MWEYTGGGGVTNMCSLCPLQEVHSLGEGGCVAVCTGETTADCDCTVSLHMHNNYEHV